ncbi:lysophospholipase [Streptomyces laurentii]|uniref:Lysophospholipase n=1 Tax=Streptomyces laurentii TaxID=39478 RepID=A0A160NYF3_STRLU|nr:lysophospholipase [Streptomyces laurentii]
MEVGERAVALADGGAYGFDDDGFRGHELVLSSPGTGVPGTPPVDGSRGTARTGLVRVGQG